MKIELGSIDREQFLVHPHVVNGEVVYLVQPNHIGVKFTQANKHFRSSVWDSDGNLVSAGFPKFTNYGENPEHFPTPNSLNKCVCVEKCDGSLLIVSKWKGQFILRTRGTVDAHKLDNGYELEIFEKTILPKLLNICNLDTWDRSFLFEWLSPDNRVVIRVNEPQFKLVGCVIHDDYALYSQDVLDYWAMNHGLLRPQTYSFDSITDLIELVKKWEGKEGVVIYSNKGQTLHKCKSNWYLTRHRLKEEFNNIEKVVDFFIQENCPDYNTLMEKIASVVDWETANEVRGDASRISDSWKNVQSIIAHMKSFVEPLRVLPRKDAALKVLSSYGETNRASFCFSLLDGKELTQDQKKKLLWQSLKK